MATDVMNEDPEATCICISWILDKLLMVLISMELHNIVLKHFGTRDNIASQMEQINFTVISTSIAIVKKQRHTAQLAIMDGSGQVANACKIAEIIITEKQECAKCVPSTPI